MPTLTPPTLSGGNWIVSNPEPSAGGPESSPWPAHNFNTYIWDILLSLCHQNTVIASTPSVRVCVSQSSMTDVIISQVSDFNNINMFKQVLISWSSVEL